MKKFDEMFNKTDRKVKVMGGEAAVAVLKAEYENGVCALVYPDGLRESFSRMALEEQLECIRLLDSFDFGLAGKRSLEEECVILDEATVKEAYGRGSIINNCIDTVLVTEDGTLLGVYIFGKVLFLGGEIAYETTLMSSDEYNGAGYKPGGSYTGTKYLTLLYLPSLLFSDVIYQSSKNKEIEELVAEEGVKTINSCAFYGCERLRRVSFPDTLTGIGYRAFSGCKNLESVRIPASVEKIGADAFSACVSLKEVVIEGVCEIESSAFDDCISLERVVLAGDGEYDLGSFVFNNCENLVEIVGAEKITAVGEYTFCRCLSLREISLSDKVHSIQSGTFSNCKSLTRLELPKMVTSIGQYAFSGCDKLEELILPSELWHIATDAFALCTGFRKITVASDTVDTVKSQLDDEVRDLVEFRTFLH